jgi:hypothetical protein
MNESNSRRTFLKTSSALVGSSFLANGSQKKIVPKSGEIKVGHGEFIYKVVPNWGLLDAGKNPVNDCHEMVEDAKGRLFLLTNEVKNNVIIYDKSGKLLESWGTSYPGAHGLTILNEGGEQFLLICDNTRHQVIKTDLKGREIFKIEYPRETGVYDHPNQFVPTETAVNPKNGDIYVADGYGANYIIQYDSKGRYIRHFGGYSSSYSDQKFNCCHGVLVDTRDPLNWSLLITDRVNQCFKRFTLDGKFITRYHLPGSFVCRPVLHGNYILAACFRSTDASWSGSGYLQILDKNMQVVSTPGGSEAIYLNGILQKQMKDDDHHVFIHPHDVYADSDENIYVPQWASGKTYPIKLERIN